MPRISISYRRDDSISITGRIFDRLVQHYGTASVFRDIDSIPLGTNFKDYIDGVLSKTDFCLLIIGPRWRGPQDAGTYRIDVPNDPVRVEVEAALRHNVTIIPILVESARMPEPHELPAALQDMAYINAAKVASDQDFDDHVNRLLRFLDAAIAERGATTGRAPQQPSARPRVAFRVGKHAVLGGIVATIVIAAVAVIVAWQMQPATIVLRGHESAVNSVSFSPDGRRIVSASDDWTVRIWDAARGAQIVVLRGHEEKVNAAAFSFDARRVVSASNDGTVRMWDAVGGTPLAVLRGHTKAVHSAAFSPDDRSIVSASDDNTVRIWDATMVKQIAVLRHDDQVNDAEYSPDGRRIVSASQDKDVRIWDVARRMMVAVLHGHTDAVNSASFSPDGRRLISASDDGTVRIWDATSGADLTVLRADGRAFESAAFSPDGKRAVSASDDGTVRIWDATNGTQLAVLRGNDGTVWSAEFSPDGKRVVSASDDKTVRIWPAPK